jgi:hypothetical protein
MLVSYWMFCLDDGISQEGSVRDEAVRTLYSEEATWTDPLTTSSDLESIVANYRSLPMVAASAQVEVLHATYTVKGENEAILRCEYHQPLHLSSLFELF